MVASQNDGTVMPTIEQQAHREIGAGGAQRRHRTAKRYGEQNRQYQGQDG